jgi:hypothetical protein
VAFPYRRRTFKSPAGAVYFDDVELVELQK